VTTPGRPVSSFSADPNEAPKYDFRCVYLTAPRMALYSRIDARCEEMVRDGLITEVVGLVANGLDLSMPAAAALGYVRVCGALCFAENIRFFNFSISPNCVSFCSTLLFQD
jgi:tRNA A37 N6-isopentenylltransferase MiaA